MLSTKLFTIKNFLLQAINYFNYNNLVKADREALGNHLSITEINLLGFSALVKKKVCQKTSLIECFPYLDGDTDYVTLASFKGLIMDINSLNKKLSTATLVIFTWNENSFGKPGLKTKIGNQNLKFNVVKDSENQDIFQICLKKVELGTIFHDVKTENFFINVLLFTSTEQRIYLVHIQSGEAGKLNIYWPSTFPTPSYEVDLHQNFTPYFKCFDSICMYTIELFKNEIKEKSMNISKNEDGICLHVDKYPTAILYYTQFIPSIIFMENLKMKLEPLFDYDIPEVANFKCRPSMLIKFEKINNTNQDYFEFQILEYEYNNITKSYFWLNNDKPITHATINFNNVPAISLKSNEIPFYTRIVSLRKIAKEIPYKIMMYFNTIKLNYEDEVYANLEKSINKVIISINSIDGRKDLTFDKKYLEITENGDRFLIELNFTQFEQNDGDLFSSIMEKRRGVFNIFVISNDRIIIESLVCLYDTKLVFMSTNKLRECLREYTQPKNKNKASSSGDNLKQGSDLESSPPVKTLPDNKSNVINANPPQGPRGVSAGGNSDTTKNPNANLPPGVSAGGKSDTTKGPNANPPQGPPGVSAGGDSGIQRLSQFTSNGERDQKISEVGESTSTSGNRVQDVNDIDSKKNQILSLNDNQDDNAIDNGGSKEPDNTIPKTKVKETTPDDAAKNTTKSKSENTATDSEDKPEKEEEKSGNKTIIIILIVVAVAVVCGLIGYIFFS